MSLRRHTARLTAAALACAALAGAHASVVYQSTWDPAYGADFPTMGWRASNLTVVSTQCQQAIGNFTGRLDAVALAGIAACTDDSPGRGISGQDTKVEFYALPGGPGTDLYETFSRIVVRPDGQCFSDCFRFIDFVDGEITGFQTEFAGLTLTNPTTAVGYLTRDDFRNTCDTDNPGQFDSRNFSWRAQLGVGQNNGAQSFLAGGYFDECGDTRSGVQPVTTIIRLSSVPEPGALALAGLALGAAGWASGAAQRRRRGA